MADSVQVEEPQRRAVGGTITTGRIHKGHGKTAASASIPSKYQTIVSDNSERKGFLSRAKRFGDVNVSANPGPGTYGEMRSSEMTSSSFSKKGFGGFVSKAKRFPRGIKDTGPGPGFYDPLTSKEHNFNKSSVTRNFHLPIALQRDTRKEQFPAPNQYTIGKTTGRVFYDNNVAACAAFRSKSKRSEDWSGATFGPSPCHYTINDRLVKDSPKIATAPFKSTTERKMMQSPVPYPGPGTYRPFETVNLKRPAAAKEQTGFHNKHYLCISAPAMPLPPLEPMPGPGHYNVVDYEGPPKHYMSSSAFVSTTSRWSGGAPGEEDLPGPATYRPQHCGKQSFIYNAQGRWI
ncbi:O(6)-methylguanine-induced apoptosis 2-like [Porites lutea]|uniref:O(6)-methylguanine-induced apoptosis 2-like n=1 Tax=Porites lutea TaxID=51062 RepID=UPI003CC6D4EF